MASRTGKPPNPKQRYTRMARRWEPVRKTGRRMKRRF
jgi:hypothetical protein